MSIQKLLDESGLGPKVGKGTYNLIHMLGSLYVVKFKIRGGQEWRAFSEAENEIAQSLHSNGIAVPKPEGVFNIVRPHDGVIIPGFVMEYIPGRVLSHIDNNYATKLWLNELKKARYLGYQLFDAGDHNAIWNERKKKLYLIDFESWELPA